jgi:MFS family permease
MAEIPGTSSRQRWTLVLVCTATFMLLLDITVVSVALPSIQRDLRASLSDLQWVCVGRLCPGAGGAAAAGGHLG